MRRPSPASAHIRPDLMREDQVRYIAHGVGALGTSRDYLASIVAHLAHLGIADPQCSALLAAVDHHLATRPRDAPPA